MARIVTVLLLVTASLSVGVTSARAEESSYDFPSCGTVVNRNTSHQFGEFAWVEYIVETVGVFDICGQWRVAVSADIVGAPDSALWRYGWLYATAIRQVPVPSYRRWETRGEHFASGTFPNPFCCNGWWPTGATASFADVVPPRTETDPEYACMLQGGTWVGFDCQIPNCPIIVDLDRNGYHLTGVEDGVRFDLDSDGTPELVAWTPPDSDDAFLVMDRNGNGRIDDGTEMFGNLMPSRIGERESTSPNGFEALAFLESPAYGSSIANLQIDGSDAAFTRLLLWRDANHNGISEPDELTAAGAAGIAAIGTEYKEKRRIDRFGNEFRQKGVISWTTGDYEPLYDVWLRWRR